MAAFYLDNSRATDVTVIDDYELIQSVDHVGEIPSYVVAGAPYTESAPTHRRSVIGFRWRGNETARFRVHTVITPDGEYLEPTSQHYNYRAVTRSDPMVSSQVYVYVDVPAQNTFYVHVPSHMGRVYIVRETEEEGQIPFCFVTGNEMARTYYNERRFKMEGYSSWKLDTVPDNMAGYEPDLDFFPEIYPLRARTDLGTYDLSTEAAQPLTPRTIGELDGNPLVGYQPILDKLRRRIYFPYDDGTYGIQEVPQDAELPIAVRCYPNYQDLKVFGYTDRIEFITNPDDTNFIEVEHSDLLQYADYTNGQTVEADLQCIGFSKYSLTVLLTGDVGSSATFTATDKDGTVVLDGVEVEATGLSDEFILDLADVPLHSVVHVTATAKTSTTVRFNIRLTPQREIQAVVPNLVLWHPDDPDVEPFHDLFSVDRHRSIDSLVLGATTYEQTYISAVYGTKLISIGLAYSTFENYATEAIHKPVFEVPTLIDLADTASIEGKRILRFVDFGGDTKTYVWDSVEHFQPDEDNASLLKQVDADGNTTGFYKRQPTYVLPFLLSDATSLDGSEWNYTGFGQADWAASTQANNFEISSLSKLDPNSETPHAQRKILFNVAHNIGRRFDTMSLDYLRSQNSQTGHGDFKGKLEYPVLAARLYPELPDRLDNRTEPTNISYDGSGKALRFWYKIEDIGKDHDWQIENVTYEGVEDLSANVIGGQRSGINHYSIFYNGKDPNAFAFEKGTVNEVANEMPTTTTVGHSYVLPEKEYQYRYLFMQVDIVETVAYNTPIFFGLEGTAPELDWGSHKAPLTNFLYRTEEHTLFPIPDQDRVDCTFPAGVRLYIDGEVYTGSTVDEDGFMTEDTDLELLGRNSIYMEAYSPVRYGASALFETRFNDYYSTWELWTPKLDRFTYFFEGRWRNIPEYRTWMSSNEYPLYLPEKVKVQLTNYSWALPDSPKALLFKPENKLAVKASPKRHVTSSIAATKASPKAHVASRVTPSKATAKKHKASSTQLQASVARYVPKSIQDEPPKPLKPVWYQPWEKGWERGDYIHNPILIRLRYSMHEWVTNPNLAQVRFSRDWVQNSVLHKPRIQPFRWIYNANLLQPRFSRDWQVVTKTRQEWNTNPFHVFHDEYWLAARLIKLSDGFWYNRNNHYFTNEWEANTNIPKYYWSTDWINFRGNQYTFELFEFTHIPNTYRMRERYPFVKHEQRHTFHSLLPAVAFEHGYQTWNKSFVNQRQYYYRSDLFAFDRVLYTNNFLSTLPASHVAPNSQDWKTHVWDNTRYTIALAEMPERFIDDNPEDHEALADNLPGYFATEQEAFNDAIANGYDPVRDVIVTTEYYPNHWIWSIRPERKGFCDGAIVYGYVRGG